MNTIFKLLILIENYTVKIIKDKKKKIIFKSQIFIFKNSIAISANRKLLKKRDVNQIKNLKSIKRIKTTLKKNDDELNNKFM